MPELTKEETAHFDAAIDLQEVAVDWAVDHMEILQASAADCCVESAAFIGALNRFFETLDVLDQAATDTAFEDIVENIANMEVPE